MSRIDFGIPTKDYNDFNYPFERFNPVQTEVLELLEKNGSKNNLVLSAATSAGKTICAEFLIDQTLKEGKKVIYLSPLKALADERFEDWSNRFKKEKITIITSDYHSTTNIIRKRLEESSIILLTSEMLDVKTRNYDLEKDLWLQKVGLLIVDESHIISSKSRGAAVEVSIIRFTLLNKKSRILFLSATMSNYLDFKNWLMMLNGKNTDVISSTWRPVELAFHFESCEVVLQDPPPIYGNGFTDYFKTEENKIETAVSVILEKVDNEKFLVFVHSKVTGKKVVKRLEKEGIETTFHNANLSKEKRRIIEQNFKDRNGTIRVLVSTSTLAWGVNLPARNVVIVGTKRGIEEVDSLDIIQMAGRAGRYGIDDAGDVYLVVLRGLIPKWKKIFEHSRPLVSKLDSPKVLAFHVLAEIHNGIINTEVELRRWCRKTLYYLQTLRIPVQTSFLLSSLKRILMVNESEPLTTTRLGEISSKMYFSPYDVSSWYFNFRKLVNIKEVDDYDISKALFDVPKNESWVPKNLKDLVAGFELKLRKKGIICSYAKSFLHVFVGYNCLCGDVSKDGMLGAINREIVFDIDRVMSTIKLILFTFKDGRRLSKVVDSISLRIKYGVSEEVVELVKIKGIGSKRGMILIDNGIYNAEDIVNKKNKRKILRLFSSVIYKTILKNSKEHLSTY